MKYQTCIILALLFVLLFALKHNLPNIKRIKPEQESSQIYEPIGDVIRDTSIDSTTYTNMDFGVSLEYLKSWLGPEVYGYENGFRLEVGTDNVYPYGTEPTQRLYSRNDSYYVIVQYDKGMAIPADNPLLMQLEKLRNQEIDQELINALTTQIKIRNINRGEIYGVEYISTLADTAQTELVYMREVILVNLNMDVVTVKGVATNVSVDDILSWKEDYALVDKNHKKEFDEIVASIIF